MDITQVSVIHHVAIVLLVLWSLNSFNYCHPISYFMSLVYLFLVHERYVMRLRKKLQFEERKQANQRKVLCDSETVRWLNYAVQKMWPICMEQIASQKILLPIIPWFLDKYKPWTAKKAVVQHLYLGRNPPMFTEMRVLRESNDDDHLVMELGMNFLTADDMSAILAVQLRKRLGFGMWTKMHMTGLHIEGKVLIGVKFLRHWPFLGRLRLCFVEPPYLQMTVKPLFNHGLDVTELPGIAGWLDNFLSIAFEQTLVEPNMLVVDMEKFVSPQSERWFSVDEKEPVAFAKVEVIEASDMKPADLNGLADPYVKGHLGPYRFRTKTQKKTLSPKWQEEFKIPICSWESPNVLAIEVRDKDHFVDDTLGDCSVNINDLRDGQRHNMWLPLQNVKMGRLRLAITVHEDNGKVPVSPGDEEEEEEEDEEEEEEENQFREEETNQDDKRDAFATGKVNKGSFSSVSSEKSPKVADVFEPINIEGKQETGIWVQQPGSEVCQTWEPRKGKSRRLDNQIQGESNHSLNSSKSGATNDSSSGDESLDGGSKNPMATVRRGLKKISSVFHRSPRRGDDYLGSIEEDSMSPRPNLRAINTKDIGVKFVVEDSLSTPASGKVASSEGSGPESPNKGHVKDMAKSILKHAGKGARTIKHVLSKKGSKKGGSSATTERDIYAESDTSDDGPPLTPVAERIVVASNPIPSNSDSQSSREDPVVQSEVEAHNEGETVETTYPDSLGVEDGNPVESPDKYDDKLVLESPKHETLDKKDANSEQ